MILFLAKTLILLLHLSIITVSFAQVPAQPPNIHEPVHHNNHNPPAQPPKIHNPPAQPPKIHEPVHHHNHNNTKKNHPPAQPPKIHEPIHHHNHNNTKKSHPPITQHPPAQAPTKSNPFPRSLVAVQGVVYCKSCKYVGGDTLLGATPLLGAKVKLECNNTKKTYLIEAETDKNGYFLINGPKSLTTYGSHKCKVSLISSPIATCNKTTDFHAGQVGALLIPKMPRVTLPRTMPVELFTVGPFAFEPSTKCI
ncbi:non-classical arabinogalactan protein 31-like [Impatiens glandulifera]|uniref:non-classical arabinogalactan protein 31-like n=1 Tax=Impatiens glandulifera TaxID=253017 RepID=UPI001FB12082|nr:non-classical arabinogalactan protein 31-like [Impatiens glandulifera]